LRGSAGGSKGSSPIGRVTQPASVSPDAALTWLRKERRLILRTGFIFAPRGFVTS
jgi:hypothetical protein